MQNRRADTVKRFRIKFKPLKFKNRNLKSQILKFTLKFDGKFAA